jgi:hypothetical protein
VVLRVSVTGALLLGDVYPAPFSLPTAVASVVTTQMESTFVDSMREINVFSSLRRHCAASIVKGLNHTSKVIHNYFSE